MPKYGPVPFQTQVTRDVVSQEYLARFRDRYALRESFTKAPVLAASLDPATVNQAALRVYTCANKDFVISGTNAANAGSVLDTAGGGVVLMTTTSNNDQVIVSPLGAINSVNGSAWSATVWGRENAASFWCTFRLGALATNRVHIGLKSTANLTETNTDKFAMLTFDTVAGRLSTTNFVLSQCNGGGSASDVQLFNTGIAASASVNYTFQMDIATSGRVAFYLNGRRIGGITPIDSTGKPFAALPASMTLLPVMGVQTLTTSAAALSIRDLVLSGTK